VCFQILYKDLSFRAKSRNLLLFGSQRNSRAHAKITQVFFLAAKRILLVVKKGCFPLWDAARFHFASDPAQETHPRIRNNAPLSYTGFSEDFCL
jgi:hypothetical protein